MIARCLEADIVIAKASYLNYSHGTKNYVRLKAFSDHYARTGSPLFDLIVFDEAHHTPAKTWLRVKKAVHIAGRNKVLHTTATPLRTDNQRIDCDRKATVVSLIDGLLYKEPFVKDLCFLEIADSAGVSDIYASCS